MTRLPAVGVILLQVGTPAAPTPRALRKYLRQFLSDRRVVDLPRPLWWPILHGIVLRTRPQRSARLYQKVWTSEGSPLAMMTAAQAASLETRLSAGGTQPVRVLAGMGYGEPSIKTALAQLKKDGVDRVLVFPMYPQYSSPTTGSGLEALFRALLPQRVVPSIRVVPPYFDDPLYIDALVVTAREALDRRPSPPDRLLLSFHGLPERYVAAGDPYASHCQRTARAFTSGLGRQVRVDVSFQSRFGREPWLQPYTDKALASFGRDGLRVAAMCPGFTADCLETLEEIAITGAETFRHAGGPAFQYIPCVNDHPAWLDAMEALPRRELAGWMGPESGSASTMPHPAERLVRVLSN